MQGLYSELAILDLCLWCSFRWWPFFGQHGNDQTWVGRLVWHFGWGDFFLTWVGGAIWLIAGAAVTIGMHVFSDFFVYLHSWSISNGTYLLCSLFDPFWICFCSPSEHFQKYLKLVTIHETVNGSGVDYLSRAAPPPPIVWVCSSKRPPVTCVFWALAITPAEDFSNALSSQLCSSYKQKARLFARSDSKFMVSLFLLMLQTTAIFFGETQSS